MQVKIENFTIAVVVFVDKSDGCCVAAWSRGVVGVFRADCGEEFPEFALEGDTWESASSLSSSSSSSLSESSSQGC